MLLVAGTQVYNEEVSGEQGRTKEYLEESTTYITRELPATARREVKLSQT